MKTSISSAILPMAILSCMSVAPCMAQQDTSYIILENTIVLQNISGRLGHMAYSAKQGTIYLAALSNNTLEVIDLQDKKTIKSIKSLRQPVDVEYLPGSNVVLVACLGDGLCRAFNASTYKEETSFRFDQNVSLVKYNPSLQTIYIGYGEGAIALIDANMLKYKLSIKLPVHPEAITIDNSSDKMYVSLTKNREIGVIDLKNNTLGKTLHLPDGAENYPLAFDKINKRLFVGCRKPAKLLVLDAENGKKLAAIDLDAEVNELFYDEVRKQIYVTCGDGYLHIVKQDIKEIKQQVEKSAAPGQTSKTTPKTGSKTKKTTSQTSKKPATNTQPQYRIVKQDTYATVVRLFTASGARTSLYLPESSQLIVAAPASGDKDARLLVYRLK
ncbi:MAG: YncE family protein [Bacteroidales bacterium]